MDSLLQLQLLCLVALVFCSALLTGAEAAYFSLGRARLKRLAEQQEERDTAFAPLLSQPHDLLVTLLVGITAVNIGAAALAAAIAERLLGGVGLVVAIPVMVGLLTVLGEVLPMTLAVEHPEAFSKIVSRPVTWLSMILTPVRIVLGSLTAVTLRLVGSERPRGEPEISEEELRTLVDVGAREGVVDRTEREMIHGVFELEDTLARELMVPRPDMICIDVTTPRDQILPTLREHLYSRFPVYEGSLDQIVGILYTKDLLPYHAGLPADFELRAHLHPPYFVPESKRADALLREFQAKKLHMAVVVDEYGDTAGLVTLEDLLEELVGEIRDEFDDDERLIQPLGPGSFRVAGRMAIDDFNTATGLQLSDQGYATVGGWVLDLFGRIPHRGERKETESCSVSVERVERTRGVEVVVTLKKAPARS